MLTLLRKPVKKITIRSLNMKILSIVTIGNNKKNILNTIASYNELLNNQFCEIIVIRTQDIEDLSLNAKNIQSFLDNGNGPYHAMNLALSKAKSKYI